MAKKHKFTKEETAIITSEYADAAIAFRNAILRMASNDRARAKELAQQAIAFMFDHPAMHLGV